MKRFPIPTKIPSSYINGRVLRDHFKRQQAAANEVTVQALKFIARNTLLPKRTRVEAQLQLTSMPYYTYMNQVSNRCVDSGRGKGVFRDFRLCRTQFREQALAGELPGVMKGVW
ncbi:BA75_01443T0 [Komagataella pastoris]|uniref:37S ribosomal protein MRP2, mitochondrial n=1 Tax=Komagataella pastoris TaxID=4922 RepID=A0A1B2J8W8_PICPA|nr:BA75_01443T0 [Komagataella pastoris]